MVNFGVRNYQNGLAIALAAAGFDDAKEQPKEQYWLYDGDKYSVTYRNVKNDYVFSGNAEPMYVCAVAINSNKINEHSVYNYEWIIVGPAGSSAEVNGRRVWLDTDRRIADYGPGYKTDLLYNVMSTGSSSYPTTMSFDICYGNTWQEAIIKAFDMIFERINYFNYIGDNKFHTYYHSATGQIYNVKPRGDASNVYICRYGINGALLMSKTDPTLGGAAGWQGWIDDKGQLFTSQSSISTYSNLGWYAGCAFLPDEVEIFDTMSHALQKFFTN